MKDLASLLPTRLDAPAARPAMPADDRGPMAFVWRAFALLAHGGDRIGIRPRRIRAAAVPVTSPDAVLAVTDRLEEALWTASVLDAALACGLVAALAEPQRVGPLSQRLGVPAPLVEGLLHVLVGLGFATRSGDLYRAAPGFKPYTGEAGRLRLAASLKAPLLQSQDFRQRAATSSLALEGWRFVDPAVIEAQGVLTAAMAEKAIPKLRFLPGLMPRLEAPGAALLDVGAGAAGLAIALCGRFPHLRATALEPAEKPAEIAAVKIAEAGLAHRIALRRERIEDVADSEAYDLVFLPQMFLPDAIMEATATNVFRALKPGGWLLAAVMSREGADLRAAVIRLRNLLWGANARSDGPVRALLLEAGFDPVIRSPGGGVIRMICARRPDRRDR